MSETSHSPTWTDPAQCPFCETELESPGAGFVRHIETSSRCKEHFDLWRDRIRGDMRAEWSG
jgi:hypothetical protein